MAKLLPKEETERQNEFIERVFEINAAYEKYAFVDTYGCQQNESDSEVIRGMLTQMGYAMTDDEKSADVIIINSCAVREHAEHRVLGNIGALVHLKRSKPDMIIGVCGCMVQQKHMAEKIKASFHHVDMVFGVHALYRLPEILYRAITEGRRIFEVTESEGAIAESLPVLRKSVIKSWVPVMYGCNNFCSYCIVPYVRGRERSREPGAIVSEIEGLVKNGCRDVTLLGQNVNSYGKDLNNDYDFSRLLSDINAVPGEFTIRFMTSHPKDASKKLFDTMAECKKVARHIHLPFQSGSNRILRAMNRSYTIEHYINLIEYARSVIPGISVTSDIIVGFPGETEEDFSGTLNTVKTVKFNQLFTFIYSKRSGTPAAEMPDNEPREVKLERFNRLLALQDEVSREINFLPPGTEIRVLVESEQNTKFGNLAARTQGNRPVHFFGNTSLVGCFVSLKVTDSSKWAMTGELTNG